ncbi:Zinc/iron permease [Apiospora phragmitis]|uniref:Zinc/iron permease n=1 Tax=Apiospora phragmitis TaxID=2905665 RepID=A0ABR1WUI9_9PEZI
MISSMHNSSAWRRALVSLLLLGEVSASHMAPHARRQQQTTTASPTSTTTSPKVTAISDCHNHGATVFCMFGTAEYQILGQATATTPPPPAYTDCHSHGSDMFCVGPDGGDIEVAPEGSAHRSGEEVEGDQHHDHDHSHEEGDAASQGGVDCHFHAGVEHCVGAGQSEGSAVAGSCKRRHREYNIPLRIGFLFVVLATSSLGAAVPIFLTRILPANFSVIFVVLKQFGTGVIISTAFIHLFTHASLMFGNECLKNQIKFEGTTAAIVMGGLVISFFVDYACHRLAKSLEGTAASVKTSGDIVNVLILEAGIIFHSILIGLTLVVAGDSFFITLFIVILFHQMFEGIALGSRIALLQKHEPSSAVNVSPLLSVEPPPVEPKTAASNSDGGGSHGSSLPLTNSSSLKPISIWKKLLMAATFGITTPIGMAIGIGVLQNFNGNDPATLIAIGTLDAVSAGILLWVGIVEMWAHDWIAAGGELVDAGAALTACASVGLLAGMALMSFLGKWA